MDYDVSLHDVVELVVVIPTSPRSSKSESGCSSYSHFSFSNFLDFLGPETPAPRRLRGHSGDTPDPYTASAVRWDEKRNAQTGDSGLGPETPAWKNSAATPTRKRQELFHPDSDFDDLGLVGIVTKSFTRSCRETS